jgi:hypothetical protein
MGGRFNKTPPVTEIREIRESKLKIVHVCDFSNQNRYAIRFAKERKVYVQVSNEKRFRISQENQNGNLF